MTTALDRMLGRSARQEIEGEKVETPPDPMQGLGMQEQIALKVLKGLIPGFDPMAIIALVKKIDDFGTRLDAALTEVSESQKRIEAKVDALSHFKEGA